MPFTLLYDGCRTLNIIGLTSGNGCEPILSLAIWYVEQNISISLAQFPRGCQTCSVFLISIRSHWLPTSVGITTIPPSVTTISSITHTVSCIPEQWRNTFARRLGKGRPRTHPDGRIPRRLFAHLSMRGAELAHLHVNYESVEAYPLQEVLDSDWESERLRPPTV